MSEEKDAPVMNWEQFIRGTVKSMGSWDLVARELVGIVLAWGAYLIFRMILTNPDTADMVPAWIAEQLQTLFLVTVVVSGLAFVIASSKSMLPAVLALGTAIILNVLGFQPAAFVALYMAGASAIVYAMR